MYQFDSRKIKQGDIFICLPGGDQYIKDAKKNGAIDVVHMNRQELAAFVKQKFNHPSGKLSVIGITGTNGKTSVSHFVYQILLKLGKKPFLLGTLNSDLTTPESLDSVRLMAQHVDNEGTHFVMEVSSHAIKQGRIAEIDFEVKCLTNITQDHLDYHKSFEEYKQTKLSFLTHPKGKAIYPDDFLSFSVPENKHLLGQFNKQNLQAAKAILVALGYEDALLDSHLEQVMPPPGRFEQVLGSQPFKVIVDYAHTPDSLAAVLKTAKDCLPSKSARVLCLFGCGGDRDRGKRKLMAKAAAELADFVVISQDNPRTEHPQQILTDILKGIPKKFEHFIIEHDRSKAIQFILNMAKPDDIVLLAGKGHETTQILATGPIEFDDRVVAKNHLKVMGYQ
jgi:UDP-N-acetylmuramoyl-L-alanyl-D-glutamate--2,6-diaminopimelate ligase